MFIVVLTYQTPLSEVDKFMQAHREFFDYHYKQGLLLASGPMKPRHGEILIVTTNDRALLESVLQQDPFSLAGITQYQIMEFTPVKHRDELIELIQKTEGKLC